ncbi:16086_t:CDS:1, partial [Gigaspora rosea]
QLDTTDKTANEKSSETLVLINDAYFRQFRLRFYRKVRKVRYNIFIIEAKPSMSPDDE